jgi:hypothetical protein
VSVCVKIIADMIGGPIGFIDRVSAQLPEELRVHDEFTKVSNGGYFIEWECGADLSADTIEARWVVVGSAVSQRVHNGEE